MKSLKLAVALFGSASLFSSIVIAHVSYKDEVTPMLASPCNWTGFYAGINVGAVKHTMNITDINATTFNATLQQELNQKLTGGLQVGYRRQLTLNSVSSVYGVELSADVAN